MQKIVKSLRIFLSDYINQRNSNVNILLSKLKQKKEKTTIEIIKDALILLYIPLIQMFCKGLIYFFYSSYFECWGIDMIYFEHYEMHLVTKCIMLIFFLLIIVFLFGLYCISDYIMLGIIAFVSGFAKIFIIYLEPDKLMIKWVISMAIELLFFMSIMSCILILILKIFDYEKKKKSREIYYSFFVIIIIISAIHSIIFSLQTGKNYFCYDSTIRLAYTKDTDSEKYYIVLWETGEKLFMKNIEYSSEKRHINVFPQKDVFIIENGDNYAFTDEDYNDVKITYNQDDVEVSYEVTMKISWVYEFVEYKGNKYVSKNLNEEIMELYKYRVLEYNEETYIVIDESEHLEIAREEIEGINVVNTLYKYGKAWNMINEYEYLKMIEEK